MQKNSKLLIIQYLGPVSSKKEDFSMEHVHKEECPENFLAQGEVWKSDVFRVRGDSNGLKIFLVKGLTIILI